MDYRRAEISDIPVLAEIRKKQLINEGQTPDVDMDQELHQYFHKRLFDGSMIEWVAEEEGQIIATAAVIFMEFPPEFKNKSGKMAYIANIYTAPEYRRRGIASEMLDRAVSEAKMRGIKELFLVASKYGRPVYKRYGFREADEWMDLSL